MEKEKKEKTNELEKEKGTKTNKPKKWLIPVIVCALVLVSVGGCFLYQNMGKKDNVEGTIKYVGDDYWLKDDDKDRSLSVMKGYGESSRVIERLEPVKLTLSPATAYKEKHVKFYGRPIVGINKDGSFKLGDWEALICEGNMKAGDQIYTLKAKFAEFAFSFDIKLGTDWPYSDIFWTIDKGRAKDINIDWGGTVRHSKIKIKVNGNTIVNKSNLSSHSEKVLSCDCRN
ncbi:hypothetical protein SAMN05216520_13612 [Kandleria vitulina]|uniref:hypothetical protein n=1 Tax=Kandleria vitulina TaxID=1630 RepID=UPI0008856363|nr:hypothetical protein [Kandleria vitulina]SDM22013.1 hypothetical protein SAMN05216520_13612 [Kandleria vitulina]